MFLEKSQNLVGTREGQKSPTDKVQKTVKFASYVGQIFYLATIALKKILDLEWVALI